MTDEALSPILLERRIRPMLARLGRPGFRGAANCVRVPATRMAALLLVILVGVAATGTSPAAARRVRGVSASIELPSETMRSGSTMLATVTVRNHTGSIVMVDGCGTWFRVVIVNAEVRNSGEWEGCLERLEVPTGRTRHRVKIAANYAACFGDDPHDGRIPECAEGKIPPLPPGNSRVTLRQHPKLVDNVPAIPIEVTR
jgi:hypothetical protein